MIDITKDQLIRLQVLYKQYEAHSLDTGATRADRLTWATEQLGRQIASFSDLTLDEGRKLIDMLQGILGVKLPSKKPRRRQTRRDGEKAGTEGRHDQLHEESTLVGDKDVRRIQGQMNRLGWNQGRLDAFLASPRGPNGRRTTILTLGDANRVYWALKRIAVREEQRNAS
jgi:hypothetical protein